MNKLRQINFFIFIFVFIPILSLTIKVEAQNENSEETSLEENNQLAATFFTEASFAYEDGKPLQAIALYNEAFRLVSDPSFAFNIAAIHYELEHFVDAYNYFNLYLRLFPGASDQIEIEELLAQLLPEIQQNYALLDAISYPTDATVFLAINEQEIYLGTTPLEWWVQPGELTFVFRKIGFQPAQTTVTSVAGLRINPILELQRTSSPVNEIVAIAKREVRTSLINATTRSMTQAITIREGTATLYLPTVSPMANVWLNNTWIGQAPARFEAIEPGEYTLELRVEGFENYSQNLTLEAGVVTGIPDVELQPLLIRMLVESDTRNTWLVANKELVGILERNESQIFEILPGSDHIMAYANHRTPLRVNFFDVQPGDELHFQLEMSRHWNERALRFWTSFLALSSAGAVTGIFYEDLESENQQTQDDANLYVQSAIISSSVITLGMVIWAILDRQQYYPNIEVE